MSEPVSNPLTLVMKIKSEQDYVELKALIERFQALPPDQNPIAVALENIGTVHFARFAFWGQIIWPLLRPTTEISRITSTPSLTKSARYSMHF